MACQSACHLVCQLYCNSFEKSKSSKITPFIVFTQSRSGSEYFMSMLSKLHPEICSSPYDCKLCPTECMDPRPSDGSCFSGNFIQSPNATVDQYLEHLFSQDSKLEPRASWALQPKNETQIRAIGYKFAWGYYIRFQKIGIENIFRHLKQRGVKVVILKRLNILNQ